MKISTLKNTPSAKELIKTLRQKTPKYSSRVFGLGSDKSIIVKKSAFVGVQISRRENELIVEGSLTSPLLSALSSFLFLEGLGYLFAYIFYYKWRELEIEIGHLLKAKYC